MSIKLGFGGEDGAIVQMAYIVEDMHAAIDWWITRAGVGPWFLLDRFGGEGHVYRGAPSTANVSIAMSFSNGLNIELIQPLDNEPSVYRETAEKAGFGFHHIDIGVVDIEGEVARRQARGEVLAYRAPVPTGGDVAYFEGGPEAPGFVEVIPITQGMDSGFTAFWQATRNWDGTDPIRAFG